MAADISRTIAHVEISWARWFAAGLVPGALSLLVVPWVVLRLLPPGIRRTPEAAEFARRELQAMGPLDRGQKIVLAIFVGVCGLWLSGPWHRLTITEAALLGTSALFLTGVLTWEDALAERGAWDVFIWYGGVIRMGEALHEFGVTRVFTERLGAYFGGIGWVPLLAVTVVIYYYAHYAFASITTHILSMFPAFLALLLARGAPAGLAVFAFACLSNLSAGLTHYGTTPSPMFFAQGYVSLRDWWRVGASVSVVNLAIWCSAGFLWWRLIGIW